MKIKYTKTYGNYVFSLIMQNISTTIFLILLALTTITIENTSFLKLFTSTSGLIIIGSIVIAGLDILRAFYVANDDKKRTGGLYGNYLITLFEDELELSYQNETKKIKFAEIKNIRIDNSMIIINFGNKDLVIVISKYFLDNKKEYKAIKKYFSKMKSKMIKKFIFN